MLELFGMVSAAYAVIMIRTELRERKGGNGSDERGQVSSSVGVELQGGTKMMYGLGVW